MCVRDSAEAARAAKHHFKQFHLPGTVRAGRQQLEAHEHVMGTMTPTTAPRWVPGPQLQSLKSQTPHSASFCLLPCLQPRTCMTWAGQVAQVKHCTTACTAVTWVGWSPQSASTCVVSEAYASACSRLINRRWLARQWVASSRSTEAAERRSGYTNVLSLHESVCVSSATR